MQEPTKKRESSYTVKPLPLARYAEQVTDDVDALFIEASNPEWEFELLQLSPGPVGSRVRVAQLPDIELYWVDYKASIHMREYSTSDGIYFAFMLDASAPARYFGRELDVAEALLYFPYQEQDYVLPADVRTLGILIRHTALKRMDWHLRRLPKHHLDPVALRHLVVCSRAITRLVKAGQLQSEDQVRTWQERLLLRLERLLQPWMKQDDMRELFSPDRSYRLVNKARHYMLSQDPLKKLSIGDLAREIGTSSRTLHRAFATVLGMGPYEYFTLLKLHAFRQAVIRQDGPCNITDLAYSAGFAHAGRFSELFRHHFGELPSRFRQRWSRQPQYRLLSKRRNAPSGCILPM